MINVIKLFKLVSTSCGMISLIAPIDGHWGGWSEWGSCSKTCNDGVKRRFRKCNNPTPAHGGRTCPGSANDQKMCIIKKCEFYNILIISLSPALVRPRPSYCAENQSQDLW